MIFRFDEKSIARSEKSKIDEPLIKIMKYSYKLNSRRSLALKKRDVYGITSNDLVVIKTLSNCLLDVIKVKNFLVKRNSLTDKKQKQIRQVMDTIVESIDKQLRVNPSAVVPEIRLKKGLHYKFTDFIGQNFSGLFRFHSPSDLQRIHDGFGLPEKVRIRTYTATGQEILMISLVRLSYPHRWEDVERFVQSGFVQFLLSQLQFPLLKLQLLCFIVQLLLLACFLVFVIIPIVNYCTQVVSKVFQE